MGKFFQNSDWLLGISKLDKDYEIPAISMDQMC